MQPFHWHPPVAPSEQEDVTRDAYPSQEAHRNGQRMTPIRAILDEHPRTTENKRKCLQAPHKGNHIHEQSSNIGV
jgi:hypothetical protein